VVTATTTLVALGSVITSTALARPPHVHGAWGTACLQNVHQDEHDDGLAGGRGGPGPFATVLLLLWTHAHRHRELQGLIWCLLPCGLTLHSAPLRGAVLH
jgi:hypothetical protein